MVIDHPDQVWCADITYIRMAHGFVYLVAIMDWYSRFVLAWDISNSLDTTFCLEALDQALEIFTHLSVPKELHVIGGADHRLTDPANRQRAIDLSVGWFKKYL